MFDPPPVAPILGVLERVGLARDYYLGVASNDYSAHPSAIGSFVDVSYGLDEVNFHVLGRSVGSHRRSGARTQTLTDPVHVLAAKELRHAFQEPRTQVRDDWYRDLAAYDSSSRWRCDDEGNPESDRLPLASIEGAAHPRDRPPSRPKCP